MHYWTLVTELIETMYGHEKQQTDGYSNVVLKIQTKNMNKVAQQHFCKCLLQLQSPGLRVDIFESLNPRQVNFKDPKQTLAGPSIAWRNTL